MRDFVQPPISPFGSSSIFHNIHFPTVSVAIKRVARPPRASKKRIENLRGKDIIKRRERNLVYGMLNSTGFLGNFQSARETTLEFSSKLLYYIMKLLFKKSLI